MSGAPARYWISPAVPNAMHPGERTTMRMSLRLALIRLAKQYGRYGYRKITALLRIEGWSVNHKKVERLWREEGLQVPRRHKARKRLYDHRHSIIRMRPLYPNHIWSVDFVQDRLFRGRRYKMLTVIDEYTRQCMTVHAQFQLTSQDVLETLSECFIRYGKPEYIRSDNVLPLESTFFGHKISCADLNQQKSNMPYCNDDCRRPPPCQ